MDFWGQQSVGVSSPESAGSSLSLRLVQHVSSVAYYTCLPDARTPVLPLEAVP